MKRIVNIMLLMLLLTSCSSELTSLEALDNCAIWQDVNTCKKIIWINA